MNHSSLPSPGRDTRTAPPPPRVTVGGGCRRRWELCACAAALSLPPFSGVAAGRPAWTEAAMSNGSSKTEACGQAVISAASESYTGRCSSSLSGLGGHYTLGLLQTPRSTADSIGGFSSGGAGLTPFRAAGSGGKEPPRSGRGGRERRLCSGRCAPYVFLLLPLAWGELR